MKLPMKLVTAGIGSLVALTSFSIPAQAAASPAATTSAVQSASEADGAHRVSTATQSAAKGGYLLRYHIDDATNSLTIDFRVSKVHSLTTSANGNVLLIKDARGRTVETIDLSTVAAEQGTNIKSSKWALTSSTEARITLSGAPAPAAVASGSGGVVVQGIRWPSGAWFDCMANHGIDGAIAGAVSGCLGASEVGCIQGAIPGAGIGMIASIIVGLWDCRGVY